MCNRLTLCGGLTYNKSLGFDSTGPSVSANASYIFMKVFAIKFSAHPCSLHELHLRQNTSNTSRLAAQILVCSEFVALQTTPPMVPPGHVHYSQLLNLKEC